MAVPTPVLGLLGVGGGGIDPGLPPTPSIGVKGRADEETIIAANCSIWQHFPDDAEKIHMPSSGGLRHDSPAYCFSRFGFGHVSEANIGRQAGDTCSKQMYKKLIAKN